jgi:hypothetical protein
MKAKISQFLSTFSKSISKDSPFKGIVQPFELGGVTRLI